MWSAPSRRYSGSYSGSLPWTKLGAVNTTNHTLTTTGITNTGLVAFTGIALAAPVCNGITPTTAVCSGTSNTYNANVTASGSGTYSWTMTKHTVAARDDAGRYKTPVQVVGDAGNTGGTYTLHVHVR